MLLSSTRDLTVLLMLFQRRRERLRALNKTKYSTAVSEYN